tara:strand:- start:393 stop:818 length:426 start_codon:yes stop_codon:yes gene_type:complete
MENKIVRQCVQGLIDDSKMIDTLCEQLETERINLVQVVTDLDKGGIAFDIDKDINKLMKALANANDSVQDASMYADNARSEAENANDSAGYASDYMDDAHTAMRDIEKAIDESKTEERYQEDVSEEQKEIDNSNQYEATNN